jgi:hypothetical protein
MWRFWWAAAAALSLSVGPALAVDAQRLLGPGDAVPGFGRIGESGFTAHGLDDAGRLLISTADFYAPPLWVGDDGFSPAIAAEDLAAYRPNDGHIDVHPSGAFTFVGVGGVEWRTIYAVIGGRLQRIAGIGDQDVAGNTLCSVDHPRINAEGAVAFEARIVTRGNLCEPPEDAAPAFNAAIYLAADGQLRRLNGSTLLGLTEDNRIILGSGELIDADGNRQRPLEDLHGPSGKLITVKGIFTASHQGKIVFWGLEEQRAGLYRADVNGVDRLFAAGEPNAPWGGNYFYTHAQYLSAVSVNSAGDVLLVTNELYAALYPADGAPRRIAGLALGGAWLNDHGQAAVVNLSSGASRALEAVRWQGDSAVRLAGSGDPLPGGGYLLQQGLSARCVGPDGSVAVVADAAPGAHGLLCADADGVRATVQLGDATPVGRRFYDFEACTIPRPGEIVFLADRLLPNEVENSIYSNYQVEPAIYRATATAIERVVGPGDVTTDGSVVAAVGRVGYYALPIFATNRRGEVLAAASFGDLRNGESDWVVREAGGALRRLGLDFVRGSGWGGIGFPPGFPLDHEYLAGLRDEPRPPATPVPGAAVQAVPRAAMPMPQTGTLYQAIADAYLLDDGSVLILAGDAYEATRLLLAGANGVTTVLSVEDPFFVAEGVEQFSAVRQVDGWIVIKGETLNRKAALYGWRLDAPQPMRLFGSDDDGTALTRSFSLDGITAAGRVYLSDYRNNRQHYFYWQDGVFHDVADFELNLSWLTNVGTDGTLYLQDAATAAVLSVGAGLGGNSCPVPPTLVLPTITITATPSATPTASATRTVTATRPATPTRTATAVPQCDVDAAACLRVGETDVAAGEATELTVRLDAPGIEIAGAQSDLVLPAGMTWGDCAVNAAIGKPDSAFRIDGNRARAVILSFNDSSPIADGATLYRCNVEVASDVAPGTYPIACSRIEVAAPTGGAIAAACSAGAIEVFAAPTATPPPLTATPTKSSGGNSIESGDGGGMGCAVAPPAGTGGGWLLALIGGLGWLRRRASRR